MRHAPPTGWANGAISQTCFAAATAIPNIRRAEIAKGEAVAQGRTSRSTVSLYPPMAEEWQLAIQHLRVAYDLRKNRDYTQLWQGIRALGDAARPLESEWWIASEYDVGTAFEFLSRFVDNDDGLVVGPLGASHFRGIRTEGIGWIARNHRRAA